jgi:hypothetical protein
MATVEELQRRLSDSRLRSIEEQMLSRILAVIEANVKRRTPVKTGNLRRTITSRVERPGVRGVVGTNASYARPVHEGSRPHTIRPRRARVLRFKKGGETIFARFVRHPGTRGQPFLLDGLAASRDTIQDILSESGQSFLSGDAL